MAPCGEEGLLAGRRVSGFSGLRARVHQSERKKNAARTAQKTQIGKSLFKWVVGLLASKMGFPVAIITTSVKSVDQLLDKFAEMASKLPDSETAGRVEMLCRTKELDLLKRIKNGGMVVLAYHVGQLRRLQKLLDALVTTGSLRPPVLLLDEADEMHRPRQMLADVYSSQREVLLPLLKQRSALVVHATATMLPLLMDMSDVQSPAGCSLDKGDDPVADFVPFSTPPTYHGIANMVPAMNADGSSMFFSEEPSARNCFLVPELMEFYKQAADMPNAVVLDITDPRVHANAGIFDKAQLLSEAEGIKDRMVIVAMSATEVHLFVDSVTCSIEIKNKSLHNPGRLIEELSKDYPGKPILIIAYSRAMRGESFRSTARTPTHVACALGRGLSMERMVQAMGRGTGIWPVGGPAVSVLTREDDMIIARAYAALLDKVNNRVEELHESRVQALRGVLTSDEQVTTCFLQTKRTVGAKKLGITSAFKAMLVQQNSETNGV